MDATAPTVYLLIGERSPPVPLVKVTEWPRRKYLQWLEISHSRIYTQLTMRTSLTKSWESKLGQDALSIANSTCIVESGSLSNCAPTIPHTFLGSHWRGSLENVGKLSTKTREQMAVSGRTWLLLAIRVENAEEEGRLTGVIASSASEGAPIWECPLRRRFEAREWSGMMVVVG